MRTLTRIIIWTFALYFFGQVLYERGYKNVTDEDIRNSLKLPEIPQSDTTVIHLKPKDTTPYKGDWIDIQ